MDGGFIDGGIMFIFGVLVYLAYLKKVGGQVDGRSVLPRQGVWHIGYPASFQWVSVIMLAQAWLAAYMVSPHVEGPVGPRTLAFYVLVVLLFCVPIVIVLDAVTTRITFDERGVVKTRLLYRSEIRWQQIETVVSDHAWHSYVLVGVEQNGQRVRVSLSRYSFGLKTFLKYLASHLPAQVVAPIADDLNVLDTITKGTAANRPLGV